MMQAVRHAHLDDGVAPVHESDLLILSQQRCVHLVDEDGVQLHKLLRACTADGADT